MKIEKVSENQIRCILTKQDLMERQIRLSELAYGSDKAKALFHDMMEQAANEYGFVTEDIPLMVEAIPLPSESIILVITKVDNPEELDTRFSRFASMGEEEEADPEIEMKAQPTIGADDVFDILKHLKEVHEQAKGQDKNSDKGKKFAKAKAQNTDISPEEVLEGLEIPEGLEVDITKMYSFDSLDHAFQLARILKGRYDGENSIYRHPGNNRFYLALRSSQHTPDEYNRICNIISEYARQENYSPATESYLWEHGKTIIMNNALQQMGNM